MNGEPTDRNPRVNTTRAVIGAPNYNTSTGQRPGRMLPVTWVSIAEPNPTNAASDSQAVFRQGWERGGAVFKRLEGAWFGDGSVFFLDERGRPAPGW